MGDDRGLRIDVRVTLATDHPGSIEIYVQRSDDQLLSHVATSRFERSSVFTYGIERNQRNLAVFARVRADGDLAATISIIRGGELLGERHLKGQRLPEATVEIGFDLSAAGEIRWLPL